MLLTLPLKSSEPHDLTRFDSELTELDMTVGERLGFDRPGAGPATRLRSRAGISGRGAGPRLTSPSVAALHRGHEVVPVKSLHAALGNDRSVGQHRLRSAEGPLGTDDPFRLAQGCQMSREAAAPRQPGGLAEEGEAAGRMQGHEPVEEQPAEQARQHPHRQDKAGPAGDRTRPVGRQAVLGTIICMGGWWVRADPQVCSTAVSPTRAQRCFGSAATVVMVSAASLNSGS